MLPLLRTKTTIPPIRPRVVERQRLREQLNEGYRRALTVVVAPAGFGKTTLVAAWAQSSLIPVAWLTLQPADRSRQRFLSYVIQALQSIAPQIGQTALALLRGASSEGALFALVNDLADIEGDFALILDDYHSVDGPEPRKILQFILENRPAAFHLVIATRKAPSLNLARLRALDQVTEIILDDLRFTPPEAGAFLEDSMGLQLAAEDLIRLNQATEGWAVGLQLAALALSRQPAGWQALAGQELIFDYLAEEVLQREPPEVQDFLEKTSLFDRFCAPLCASILYPGQDLGTYEQQYKNLLAYIDRANLFLAPLDSGDVWYRYHALFADFLRRQVPEDEALSLYRRASDWFEQNGMPDDAIHYATHATDYERAAGLLENHYIDLLKRGEQAALLEWIAAMPPEALDHHPRLWLARGWAYIISFNTSKAVACAERAEASILPDQSADRLRSEVKSLRILANIFAGSAVDSIEISSALSLLPDQDKFLRTLMYFNLGLNHVMHGETAQALDAFQETLCLTQSQENPLVSIVAQVQMGETRQIRGALGMAERVFQQAIRYTKETLGEQSFLLGIPYVSYAELLREQNRFDEAIDYGEKGITYCQIWQPMASMDGQITLARLTASQGSWDESTNRLEHAMRVAANSPSVIDDAFVAIHMTRLMLLRSDRARASHIIQAYNLSDASPQMYYHLWELTQLVLLRAQILELAGGTTPAGSLSQGLSALIAEAGRRERVTPLIEALILSGYVQLHAGQRRAAGDYLSRALSLGAQSGYVRIFADEGNRLLQLLEECRPYIHAPRSYFEQILSILRIESNQPAPPVQAMPEGLTPLTRRELDILALLAGGKSNQEIAAERVLALNTVKKHVANILRKLGVANRTQAVMLAKKLGWLE